MTAALVPLQNITLTGSAATVTFANIPSTGFRDLRLVVSGIESAAGSTDARLRANGDSGTNYYRVYMFGTGSSAVSGTDSATAYQPWYSADTIGHAVIDIFDYAQTDKHKTLITRSNNANASSNGVSAQAQRWANTAAITSLTWSLTSTYTFNAGSTFALYGVVA